MIRIHSGVSTLVIVTHTMPAIFILGWAILGLLPWLQRRKDR